MKEYQLASIIDQLKTDGKTTVTPMDIFKKTRDESLDDVYDCMRGRFAQKYIREITSSDGAHLIPKHQKTFVIL